MDAHFHDTDLLPPEVMKPLLERKDQPALSRFMIQYALLLTGAGLVITNTTLWLTIVGVFIFAVMTMGMFALAHETAHNTAFHSRQLNRLVCWLVTIPIYYVPTGFREFHFEHHRHTHDPLRDPEIAIGGKPAPAQTQNLFLYLVFGTGLPILFYKIGLLASASLGGPDFIWQRFLNYVPERSRQRLTWEARLGVLFHLAWIVVGYLWLPGLLTLLWGQVLGHLFLTRCLMAEHTGLPHEGTIFERTRTTATHPLVKWLMWNMPYHAEHHAYPAVPWHALPQLHAIVQPELCHHQAGYVDFHRKIRRALFRGQPFQDV